jgi:hypothetical protein
MDFFCDCPICKKKDINGKGKYLCKKTFKKHRNKRIKLSESSFTKEKTSTEESSTSENTEVHIDLSSSDYNSSEGEVSTFSIKKKPENLQAQTQQ